MASMLHNFVEVESKPSSSPRHHEPITPLQTPAKAVSRTYPGAPQEPESIELRRLSEDDGRSTEPTTPRAEQDLEMSRPTTPTTPNEAVEALPSVWDPFMNRFRLAAICCASLVNGLNDSAAGALIPYMEK